MQISSNKIYDAAMNSIGANEEDLYQDHWDQSIADAITQAITENIEGLEALDSSDVQILIDIAQNELEDPSLEVVIEKVLSMLGVEDTEKASEKDSKAESEFEDFMIARLASEIDALATDGEILLTQSQQLADMLGDSVTVEEVDILIKDTAGDVDAIILELLYNT